MEAGCKFQFFEVIGTNVLANEVVGTFPIWPRKSVGNRENACYAQSTLWGELLTLTLVINIYIYEKRYFSKYLIMGDKLSTASD